MYASFIPVLDEGRPTSEKPCSSLPLFGMAWYVAPKLAIPVIGHKPCPRTSSSVCASVPQLLDIIVSDEPRDWTLDVARVCCETQTKTLHK